MNESGRIETLKLYSILDTPPDGTFDTMVRLVAKLLDVPIALVSLVDTDRIWFKSSFGLEAKEIPKEKGLCASAILSDEFYLIEDALKDPRTLENSLVTGEFGLRFYAASPLTTSDGYNLGTICVLDKKPRTMNDSEKEILESFAKLIMEQLELRLTARLAINAQNKMSYMVTHEIRNTISYVPSLLDLLVKNKNNETEVVKLVELIKHASVKTIEAVDSFLDFTKKSSREIKYQFEVLDLSQLVLERLEVATTLALIKKQKIFFDVSPSIKVYGDADKLKEMIDNLISNAIKFTHQEKTINVNLKKEDAIIYFDIQDEGQGMSLQDVNNAFTRFGKLSAKPTGDEPSTGLGLWIVKEIIEQHSGSVRIKSEGKDKGTLVRVELPYMSTKE